MRRKTLPKLNLALVLVYAVALASVFFVKEKILEDGGYRIMGAVFGQDQASIGTAWKLSIFSADIALMLVAVPAVFALIRWTGGEKAFSRSVFLVSVALVSFSFVNVNSIGTIGKFLSADQISPMLTWVSERPQAVFEYISPGALAKFAVLLGMMAALYRLRGQLPFRRYGIGPAGVIACVAAAGGIALAARLADHHARTPYYTPVAVQMAEALLPSANASVAPSDARAAAPDLHYSCPPAQGGPKGVAATGRKPRNVILFIMETVPYDLYSAAEAQGLPAFSELEKSAFVNEHHYTTYPFTSYARFSIFTGLYPSYRLEKTLPLSFHRPYHSVFASLVGQGYDFRVFDPVQKRYPVDDWVVHQVGGEIVSTEISGDVEQKDEAVLDALVASIKQKAAAKQPFVYAYLPQLTHGPWLPPGDDRMITLYDEGIRRLRLLDRSMGRIVAALRESGIYDDTVIVVTADHGLRTRKEAPFLKTAVLNDVSYHVPLVIHDPQLGKTIALKGMTSHIDISPTLYCLYARDKSGIDTQGVAMSAAGTPPRPIFFGGEWYNGSGGVWTKGTFYSFNRELNMVWKSDRFDFDENRPLVEGQAPHDIGLLLERQGARQERLLSSH